MQPFPGPGRRWQISADGGGSALWNPKGRELFYASGGTIFVVDVETSPNLAAGRPRVLYEGPYPGYSSQEQAVSPDGQKFLAIQSIEPEQPATQISVILNWAAGLKK